jgi:hypothetical protein
LVYGFTTCYSSKTFYKSGSKALVSDPDKAHGAPKKEEVTKSSVDAYLLGCPYFSAYGAVPTLRVGRQRVVRRLHQVCSMMEAGRAGGGDGQGLATT